MLVRRGTVCLCCEGYRMPYLRLDLGTPEPNPYLTRTVLLRCSITLSRMAISLRSYLPSRCMGEMYVQGVWAYLTVQHMYACPQVVCACLDVPFGYTQCTHSAHAHGVHTEYIGGTHVIHTGTLCVRMTMYIPVCTPIGHGCSHLPCHRGMLSCAPPMQAAVARRDSFIRQLYYSLLRWVAAKLNNTLGPHNSTACLILAEVCCVLCAACCVLCEV